MESHHSASSPSTSPSLLVRACDGKADAWQRIVQIYGPLVYNWARRTGLQPSDASDVMQETLSAVSTKLASFDSHRQGATFRGWLWTITRNKAADHVRRLSDEPAARGGSTNLAALSGAFASSELKMPEESEIRAPSEQSEIVNRTLTILRSSFERTTWQAFWRTVVDGNSPDDVAAELGLSRWAVYKARSRILQRLRTELQGLEELPE